MNLVTGATGIIDSHVVLKLLQENKSVVATKQVNSDVSRVKKLFGYYTSDADKLFQKIKWVEVDVRDIFSVDEALDGITQVYHCAGYVSFDSRNRDKLFKINEVGTANVVNACLLKNIPLCHVSSIATINNLDYTQVLDETVFWKTSGRESDYALSKYNAEREVWRGIEEGLKAVIVNPGVVLSPGFWDQSSSKIFSTCYKGNSFYTQGVAGWVAASDVATAMILLSETKQYANRYILVENNYTFKHIFDLIQGKFKKKKPFINASAGMLRIGAMADKIISKIKAREPSLTKSIIHSALNTQQFSNKKIINTSGITFQPVDEVIEQICQFYLQDLQKGR